MLLKKFHRYNYYWCTQTKSLATYKSGKYANYINVEIQVDFEDGYRILTISY
jgi:hypothetical protein